MRTTLDLQPHLLDMVMQLSHARSKKRAIEIALEEYLRIKKREELSLLIGNYENYSLTLPELKRMRKYDRSRIRSR